MYSEAVGVRRETAMRLAAGEAPKSDTGGLGGEGSKVAGNKRGGRGEEGRNDVP